LNRRRGTATKVFNFKAHNNKVIALKLRGNILVTGSNDGYLGVWNIKTSKCEREIEVGADIICVDFIEHKNVIACGSYYGYVITFMLKRIKKQVANDVNFFTIDDIK
jgi:WD40 repeat protein